MSRFDHEDSLAEFGKHAGLNGKIVSIHKSIRAHFPFVSRIAAALYDPPTDTLKTFIHSSDENDPLVHYQAKLADSPSLKKIKQHGRSRVIDDLSELPGNRRHTRHIRKQGHLSSYTIPMYERETLLGFLFFNSRRKMSFTEDVLRQLDPYGHMLAMSISNELKSWHNLRAAAQTARDFHHLRDDETGMHLDRMSRFSRVIAKHMAPQCGFTDEHIESIFIFAPLHDIGKLGIPDHIMFKQGQLTEEEFAIMKTHTTKGRQLADHMLKNFALEDSPHAQVLRSIVELHHETLDGQGYPYGHRHDDVPIEARIVAVADIFDALTSRRSYKRAWSNDEAFARLKQLSGTKLDADCVNILIAHRQEIEAIQHQFRERSFN